MLPDYGYVPSDVRICTGAMLVGPAKALFLDEISTGLDSSTAFQIMRSLRHLAHIRQATLLVALLQPTPETYHLFDDIMLLSEGGLGTGPRQLLLQSAWQYHHEGRLG